MPSVVVIPSPSINNGLTALDPPYGRILNLRISVLPLGRPYDDTGSTHAGYNTSGDKHAGIHTTYWMSMSLDERWWMAV